MTMRLDPITHDLVVENFQFAEVSTLSEDLGQRIKIKLMMFLGEWFLNENYGIPYFQTIFVKSTDIEEIDDIFKVAIASERGVESILSYSSEFNRSTRYFVVDVTIKTTEGIILPISVSL